MTTKLPRADALFNRNASPSQWALAAALEPLDKVARETEARWGSTVLETLAAPDVAARFASARKKLSDAVELGDSQEASKRAAILIRGWAALEQSAIDAGYTPGAVDRVWHVTSENGKQFVFVQHESDAHAVAKAHPKATVWSMAEVVRVLDHHTLTTVLAIKGIWPGATVSEVRPASVSIDDEIPF